MSLIVLPLALLATWFIVKANQTHARIPTCRYGELAELIETAQSYTAGYWGIAFCGAFLPNGLAMTAWVLGYAAICRIQAARA